MNITFLRLRPSSALTVGAAESRRREGTTVIELAEVDEAALESVLAGGLLPVTNGSTNSQAAAWVVPAAATANLEPGWRITIDAGNASFEALLDAV
ncbi:MAG: hypothetical protein ACRDVK_04615, partial [Acidimicrobiia bacterium]